MKKLFSLCIITLISLYFTNYSIAQSCSSAQCGGAGSGGCYCDDGCWTYGDCCPNVCTFCGLSTATHTTNCTANCANGTLTGSQTAHICTFTNLNVGSGERRDIPGVINGYSYRIELNSCPSGWWYTITGRRSTDNAVVFNQYAFCNIGFNWTANFSGTIRVNIRRANCLGYQGAGSGNSAILQYRQNTPVSGSTTNWVGTVAGADNWNNGLNWDNCIPNIDIHANIPNVGQQPGINTAGAACRTLTIATGRTLSVCSGCLTQFGDP
jgi:hypothetical protein